MSIKKLYKIIKTTPLSNPVTKEIKNAEIYLFLGFQQVGEW